MQPALCGYSDAEFVAIYDTCIAETFLDRLFPIIQRLVLQHIPRQARVLDLCCGTGNLASRLSDCGYQVTGIDTSTAMLDRARRKLPQATFIQEDARCVQLHQRFHAAFCTFNALAHFGSPEDLYRVFSAVHDSIAAGGFFLFDLNTEQAYRERWRGSFGSTHHGTDWQVEPWYDHTSRTAHNRITLKNGNQASELNLTQHCFHQTEIIAALLASGFEQSRSFDATHELGIPNESGRLIVLAKKAA
jgi:SAM-dependent methyltransferase